MSAEISYAPRCVPEASVTGAGDDYSRAPLLAVAQRRYHPGMKRFIVAFVIAGVCANVAVRAQQGTLGAADKQRRVDAEAELQSIAIVERKVMLPMPDGVRLATDIYRPKNAAGKVPTIFVRTPYNFNFWDVDNGVPADMTAPLAAVKRGYAYVVQNERGHFFSEGNYDILGSPSRTASTRSTG